MTYSDALDCIRAAGFYDSSTFSWARPLVDAVLSDSFDDEVVTKVLDSVCCQAPANAPDSPPPTARTTAVIDPELPAQPLCISRICSIDTIENVGLVNRDSPILLQDGLTVFYGKNAAGKSSIFSALVNTLGVSKRAAPNLGGTDKKVACAITVHADGEEKKLRWSGAVLALAGGVRVLDSDACMNIVEKEQANDFELAHLRTEYFDLLSEALERLASGLDERKSNARSQYNSLKNIVQASIPKIASLEQWLGRHRNELENAEFTEEETTELAALETKVATLGQQDPAVGAKRLESASLAARSILGILGEVTTVELDNGEVEIAWSQSVGAGATLLNASVVENRALLKATERSSVTSLAGALPDDWPENPLWREFILASLAFVSSLGGDEVERYTNDNCPMCLQPLQSAEARALLAVYRALEGEQFKELEASNAKLDRTTADLVATGERLGDLPANLKLVNAEFAARENGEVLSLDVPELTQHLNAQADAIRDREEVPAAPDAVTAAGALGQKLVEFCNNAQGQISTLRGQTKDRAEEIRQIEESVDRLRLKMKLIASRSKLLEMFDCSEADQTLQDRATSLTQLKRAVSTAHTAFSRDEPLAAFKRYLKEEYKRLRFQPPSYWSLTSRTSPSGNVRVYSLGDRRLSEILSEGERKIHAIADFLAEGELNEFTGVYVFDDPVNSLDEERIESVSDRILRLEEDGNQVIVFTHNLLFLNSLLDTQKTKVMRIERLESTVIVEDDVILGTDSEMSKRLKSIKERMRALDRSQDLQRDEYSVRNVYDLISGYLESYFEQKILSNVINRYRRNLRMDSIDRLLQIDEAKLTSLQLLYRQTSRKGARHSQPTGSSLPTYDELREHFDRLSSEFGLGK